jgi:hypothetical protein
VKPRANYNLDCGGKSSKRKRLVSKIDNIKENILKQDFTQLSKKKIKGRCLIAPL